MPGDRGSKEAAAGLYRQILSMDASATGATPRVAAGAATATALPSSVAVRAARALASPAFVAGAVAFAGCTLALTTQPRLRRWLTLLWDGDVEARKLRKRVARANKKVAASLAECQAQAADIQAKLDLLEKDLARWKQEAARAAREAAARLDPDHQKHSGYYHFASTGTKYVNKWDSFDPDEEIKKIDGEGGSGEGEGDDAGDGSTGGGGGGSGRRPPPSLDALTRRAREVAVAAKTLLDRRLDGITHEMANSPDLFGGSVKLRRKRQRLSKKLNETLVPRSQRLVAALREVRKRQQQQQQRRREEAGTAGASPGSGDGSGGVESPPVPRPLRSAADIAETAAGPAAGSPPATATQRSVAGSAWNKDNRQYEEKSVLEWAQARLLRLLRGVGLDTGNDAAVARVADVRTCTGIAAVTATSRGPGCVFSFDEVKCGWTTNGDLAGTLTISDVDVTDVSDAEMAEPLTVTVAVTAGAAGAPGAAAALRTSAARALKQCFRDLLHDMQAEFVHAAQ